MKAIITKLDHFGRGICFINEKICFVPFALPNEEVEIEIESENKKFYIGKLIKVIKESPNRIKPKCQYFGLCGGCSLQHMTFDFENTFKENKIKEILEKFAHIDGSIVSPIVYQNDYFYRNKITLHKKGNRAGFYMDHSHEIVPIKECLLALPIINDYLNNHSVDDNFIIKCSNDGLHLLTSADVGLLKTNIGNIFYNQGISSFFQINAYLTKLLYDEVLKNIMAIRPKHCLDLYCGCGTIGIYVSKYCESIIGVDNNISNINDARENASMNSISNILFICDDVENVIDSFQNIDCVIVDPPRNGLDKKTKDVLKKISPNDIIYVSCDPVTLARDIYDLSDAYVAKSVTPFNMFPRTAHCESITVLERR